ncbi:surface-adhesin E family protein [Epilithonimonas sp.]|uniref:surface-adhesin E family protein n=1 Tax=Epilithonimonas sp. TaxID=2894511 RepID=UPI00289F2435|nr:surface-adhesin E family protein [Epilithonimonas sp.]
MKILFTSFCCIISACFYSQTEWEFISSSSNGSKWYLKNITKPKYASSDDYDFWVKIIEEPKKYKNKKGVWITKNSNSTLRHLKLNCSEKQITTISRTDYNFEGVVIDSDNIPQTSEIIPDSMGEAIYDYVCNRP